VYEGLAVGGYTCLSLRRVHHGVPLQIGINSVKQSIINGVPTVYGRCTLVGVPRRCPTDWPELPSSLGLYEGLSVLGIYNCRYWSVWTVVVRLRTRLPTREAIPDHLVKRVNNVRRCTVYEGLAVGVPRRVYGRLGGQERWPALTHGGSGSSIIELPPSAARLEGPGGPDYQCYILRIYRGYARTEPILTYI